MCDICGSGYGVEGLYCKKCHFSCIECNGEKPNNCLSCNNSIGKYIFQNNTCDDCLHNNGFLLKNTFCYRCAPNCLKCTGEQEKDCLEC